MNKESSACQDALYVNWHLLDGLNHDTPYSHEPDSVINERFFREPLLETAYHLLSLNRPEYIFHLYGGEPTIHPYFADLVQYLATSGRNVHMILETNGIRQLKYYSKLLYPVAPGRMCVRFGVHLKCMDLEKVLTFVGFVVDQKQLCQVIINWVPEYDAKAQLFYEKFTQLQRVLSFGVSLVFPMGGKAQWLTLYKDRHLQMDPVFPAWTQLPSHKSSSVEKVFDSNFHVAVDEAVSCVGVNAVQVDHDGNCTLGLTQDDEPFAPQLLSGASLREDLPPAIAFDTMEEGEEWLKAFSHRALAYEINGGPVRNPLANNSVEQKIRCKLKRLAPVSRYQRKLTVYPELWRERREDIFQVYEALADEASREVLLRRVKAQLFGLSAYLVSSEYGQFCHPAFADIPYEAGAPSLRRLRFETIKAKELENLKAKIAWYRPALELVLPSSPEWLEILTALTSTLPDYTFYLGQHGVQTICYAQSTTPRKRYQPLPLRTIDGNPLVSIILKASDDEETLSKTIESVEQERLARYEVIIVQDASTLTESVDELVRKNPWHIRAFRFNEDLSLSRAWDAGLDMAQGEYVCFVRAGDQLQCGALQEAVNALEEEKSGLAIFTQDLSRSFVIEGKAALSRFLTGELPHKGVRNSVYQASFMHDYAIELMDLPGDLEDELFILPMLTFADKVSCIKGSLVQEEREDESTAQERFEVFTKNMGKIRAFCKAHGIASDSPEFKAYATRLFNDIEEDFTTLVHEADESESLDELLTQEVLADLKCVPDIARRLFRKCLARVSKRSDLPEITLFEGSPLSVSVEEYPSASQYYEHSPKLSLIMTVTDSDSLSLLESVIEEDVSTVECLVLNSVESSETKDRLEEIADLSPNVRLWHTDGKASLLQAVRHAMKEARGCGVTFVKGKDEVDSDFFESAVQAFSLKEHVDLAIFGLQNFAGEGRDLSSLEEGICDPGKVLGGFLEQEKSFDLRGIVFAKEFLQESFSDFEPVFPEEGDEYLLCALKNAAKIYVSQTGSVSTADDSEEESTRLLARNCEVIQSLDNITHALKGLLSESKEQESENFESSDPNVADSLVMAYIRKALSEKYLPTLLQMTEGDLVKAEELCGLHDYAVSDLQLKILSAESSMECEADEQE